MAFLTAHKDEYSARVEEIMETEGVDSSEAEDIAEGEITMGELNKFFKKEQTPKTKATGGAPQQSEWDKNSAIGKKIDDLEETGRLNLGEPGTLSMLNTIKSMAKRSKESNADDFLKNLKSTLDKGSKEFFMSDKDYKTMKDLVDKMNETPGVAPEQKTDAFGTSKEMGGGIGGGQKDLLGKKSALADPNRPDIQAEMEQEMEDQLSGTGTDFEDEEGLALAFETVKKRYANDPQRLAALEKLEAKNPNLSPQATKPASTQAKTQKPSNPNLNKGEILYDDESIKTQPEEVQKAYQLGKETLSEENKNELESIINAWNNPTNNSEQIPFKDFLKEAVANSDNVRGGLNSRETEAFGNQIDEIYKNLYGESARTNPQADTNVVPKRQGKPAKPSNPPLSQVDDQVKNAIAETNSGNLIYNNFLEDMNDNGIENPTVEDFKDYLAMTEDTSIEEYNNTGDEFLREQSTEARAIFDSLERTQKDIPTPQSITESQNAIRSLVSEYQSKDDIATDVFYRVGKAIDKDTDAQSAINKFRENFEKYYDPTDRHLTSLDELEQKLGLKNETQPQTESVATNTEGNYKRDDGKFESNLAAYERSLTNRPLQINGKPVDIRTFTETLKADMLKDKGFLNSNYMDEKEDGSTVEQIADDHVWDYLDYLTDNESEFIGDNEYGIGDQAEVSSSAQEALQKNKK